MAARKTFLIIDANSVIHRAFHALPELSDRKGEPAQAVYGFALAFMHIAKELDPDYAVACFDTKKPTFRHEKFAGYKAQRPATPAALVGQFSKVLELLNGFGVKTFSLEGYEADDLIATVASKASSAAATLDKNIDICVLTGDYDSLQLVNGVARVYLVTRGVKKAVIYDSQAVFEKFGVNPDQIAAFKALSGDASDNIPGAPGIGQKTAAGLLQRYGSIEKIYGALESAADEFLGSAAVKESLRSNKESILLFEGLTNLDREVPIDFDLEGCKFTRFAGELPRQTLENFGFVSLAKRLPGKEGQCLTRSLF